MSEHARAEGPDLVHRLGFEAIYRLPQFDFGGAHSSSLPALDADASMATLSPEQRDRAHNIAARRLAMQLLYQLDMQGEREPATMVKEELARVENLGPLVSAKVEQWVLGAFAARAQADKDFTALAPEWPAHRQPGVDRAILRLAHYELTQSLNPPRIAMSEAIDLARAFSTEKSPAFINGLLDKVAQRVERKDA
jgi:transcription antitermination protein NusB